jgi:lysophospholipid acyltransferase (LPLAT)-like uncharacterized protein
MADDNKAIPSKAPIAKPIGAVGIPTKTPVAKPIGATSVSKSRDLTGLSMEELGNIKVAPEKKMHNGGPVMADGVYRLKAGEHVLTAPEAAKAKKHAMMASGMKSLAKSGKAISKKAKE